MWGFFMFTHNDLPGGLSASKVAQSVNSQTYENTSRRRKKLVAQGAENLPHSVEYLFVFLRGHHLGPHNRKTADTMKATILRSIGGPQAMPLWLWAIIIILAGLALYFLIQLLLAILNALGHLFGQADVPGFIWDIVYPVLS